jgi:hypothetical protein
MADCALSLFLGAVPVTVIEIAKLLGARVPRAPARTSPA